MTTWIALLRGINVGGKHIVPMEKLRNLLEGAGWRNVRTYIQSGNCVLEGGSRSQASVAKSISQGIEAQFGFAPQVVVLTAQELDQALANNPFPEAEKDPKSLHLFFLESASKRKDLKGLEAFARPGEGYRLLGKVAYLHTPEGLSSSKLATKIESHLGVPTTARNLRSCRKIAELAASTGH